MIDNNSFLFNIIYTPNTVVRFLPFVKTLIKNSKFNFRLVSNGCSLPERKFLQIFCAKEERLEYLAFPGTYMETHGKVLNYLQAIDKNREYLCFMDSDIFSINNFDNIVKYFSEDKDLTALFSGAPVWLKKSELIAPDNLKLLVGYYHWNENMLCHGSTFFAIYKNKILNKIIQNTAIGFEMSHFDFLPKDIQKILVEINVQKEIYDTGKVLNLLLIHNQNNLKYVDIDNLIHIGGSSSHAIKQINQKPEKYLSEDISIKVSKDNITKMLFEDNKEIFKRHYQMGLYFSDLISALQMKITTPTFPIINDIEIKNNVERASNELVSIYN